MAQNSIQRGIVDSWGLIDFIRTNGVPDFQHKIQGANGEFDALFFPTPRGDRNSTMVAISSNLNVHTLEEIFNLRKELQVVELDETHNLYLCKQGGERELGSNYNWI